MAFPASPTNGQIHSVTGVGDYVYTTATDDWAFIGVAQTPSDGFGIVTGDSGTATSDVPTDTLTITGGAGSGIVTVGSDAPEDLNIALDIANMTDEVAPAIGDELALNNISGPNLRKADVASIVNLADHNVLTNYLSTEHFLQSAITTVGTVTAGDVSGAIPADSVTMDMLVDIATDTFLGRITAATGTVEVLTNANAKTMLDLTGTNSGDEPAASTTVVGVSEFATAAEIDTGTSTLLSMPVDQFQLSNRNIRWLVFNLVEAGTAVAVATNIGGDFVSPIAGTILQSDTTPFYIYATQSTAGTHTTVGLVVDVLIGGASIFTTDFLDFDTTEKTTTTAGTPPNVTTTSLAVGNIITIDVDSIQDGTAGLGLTVYMAVRET